MSEEARDHVRATRSNDLADQIRAYNFPSRGGRKTTRLEQNRIKYAMADRFPRGRWMTDMLLEVVLTRWGILEVTQVREKDVQAILDFIEELEP